MGINRPTGNPIHSQALFFSVFFLDGAHAIRLLDFAHGPLTGAV